MKKTLSICAICAVFAVSCDKQLSSKEPVPSEEGYASVSFSFSDGAFTRAMTNEENEKTLQNVQIFIFKAGSSANDGILEMSYKDGFAIPLNVNTGSYSTSKPIRCTAGEKNIFVICNDVIDRTAPEVGILTLDQLLNQTNELKNNAPDKLLMVGSLSRKFSEGDQSCSVDVKRMCAAIVLRSIKNAFISPAYQADDCFRIVELFLLNVPSLQNFNMSAQFDPAKLDASKWYSKMAVETGDLRSSLIYDAAQPNPKTVNYNTTYEPVHTFYMYPNSRPYSEEPTWVEGGRATLLVVKSQINNGSGWFDSYYTLPLDQSPIKSNQKYVVDLTINRPGSDDPNRRVDFSDVTPSISVLPWTEGDSYTPVI